MNPAIVKALLNAIDKLVEQTENTWDNAAAILLRFLAQQYLGIKQGEGCPDDCQAVCNELHAELEQIVAADKNSPPTDD